MQRTIKLYKDILCFNLLRKEVERICLWLKGQKYELCYHIYETSQKKYISISNNVEVMQVADI